MSIDNVRRKKLTVVRRPRLSAGLFEGEARQEARRKEGALERQAVSKEKTTKMPAKQFYAGLERERTMVVDGRPRR